MTPRLFEEQVLAKTYFDRFGLILALDGDRPVGFVHAGFGPRGDLATLGSEVGVTCLLLVTPRPDSRQIAEELLAQSEAYLKARGVRLLLAGPSHPANPFYLGHYGGSQQSGVLVSDAAASALYRDSGYSEAARTVILQRHLSGFRPLVDRKQMQLRRQFQVETIVDPAAESWWEACIWGETQRTRFQLRERAGSVPCGHLTFWDLQPLAGSWGVQAAGLSQLEVSVTGRRKGLATFLIGEAFRQLQTQGVKLVEVQFPEDNLAAIGLYLKLGFEEVDRAISFSKSAGEVH